MALFVLKQCSSCICSFLMPFVCLMLVTALLITLHHPSCHLWTLAWLLLCFLDNDHKCKTSLQSVQKNANNTYFIFWTYYIYLSKAYRVNIEQHISQPCLFLNPVGCNHCIPRKWFPLMLTSPVFYSLLSSPYCHQWQDTWGAEKNSPNQEMFIPHLG